MINLKFSDIPKLSQLQRLFLLLSAIASAAAIKAMIFPAWPSVEAFNTKPIIASLESSGFVLNPLKSLSAKRSAEMATSTIYRYSLPQGNVLAFFRGRSKQRFNFQASFLNKADDSLRINNRILYNASLPYSAGIADHKYTRQTCLVEGYQFPNGFGVTREQLTQLVDAKSTGIDKQIRYVIGLTSNRDYECILISLSNQKAPVDEKSWVLLLKAFQAGLPHDNHP